MSETLRLLAAARDGEPLAFDRLFDRHRARLISFVAARVATALRPRFDAEDVVQETYLEAHRKLDAFEPTGPAAFYRWLVAIADRKRQEAIRHHRAKKRDGGETLHAEPALQQTSVGGRAARAEGARTLVALLERIPADQAQAVKLRYLQGCSLTDTAQQMDRSPAAVKGLVARGMAALSEHIARNPDFPGP